MVAKMYVFASGMYVEIIVFFENNEPQKWKLWVRTFDKTNFDELLKIVKHPPCRSSSS